MKNAFSENNQVRVVSSFNDLVNSSFNGIVNALCWKRNLTGNFKEIADKLSLEEDITEISIENLLSLELSEDGVVARQIIINDFKLLRDFGASPSLNLLKKYERDDEFDFISTDVYSFHVDRSPIGTDTFLCTYFGAASEIVPNDEVTQKIHIPEIREKLKLIHSNSDEDFESFLKDNFFDLHYELKPNAKPVNLETGNLWRLAVDHPEQKVLPCVHRAPLENEGECRLLLIC